MDGIILALLMPAVTETMHAHAKSRNIGIIIAVEALVLIVRLAQELSNLAVLIVIAKINATVHIMMIIIAAELAVS